ncbi:unnamed protein product [Amoebophrya sp. A25]|nr:unnamed protein product [Amoebophrya sp. A25]|eukprot:GSA25T00019330001.1
MPLSRCSKLRQDRKRATCGRRNVLASGLAVAPVGLAVRFHHRELDLRTGNEGGKPLTLMELTYKSLADLTPKISEDEAKNMIRNNLVNIKEKARTGMQGTLQDKTNAYLTDARRTIVGRENVEAGSIDSQHPDADKIDAEHLKRYEDGLKKLEYHPTSTTDGVSDMWDTLEKLHGLETILEKVSTPKEKAELRGIFEEFSKGLSDAWHREVGRFDVSGHFSASKMGAGYEQARARERTMQVRRNSVSGFVRVWRKIFGEKIAIAASDAVALQTRPDGGTEEIKESLATVKAGVKMFFDKLMFKIPELKDKLEEYIKNSKSSSSSVASTSPDKNSERLSSSATSHGHDGAVNPNPDDAVRNLCNELSAYIKDEPQEELVTLEEDRNPEFAMDEPQDMNPGTEGSAKPESRSHEISGSRLKNTLAMLGNKLKLTGEGWAPSMRKKVLNDEEEQMEKGRALDHAFAVGAHPPE